ncbi:uncharacterized protein [Lepisosteus oculatus]|uniref:uncharacterized protein isoform X2 n=1 Tax=Lepisosteus oculatus TaxID=7918 RepID=UPI0037110B36
MQDSYIRRCYFALHFCLYIQEVAKKGDFCNLKVGFYFKCFVLRGQEMLLILLILQCAIRTAFCETLSCEHYLSRRVAGVFHYDRNIRYNLTFQEAKEACEKDFAASLADRMQLFTAYQQGLEECRAGWISSAEVAYPRVHKNWNCGQNHTGIITYGIRENLLERWDVFCYKEDNNCSVYPTFFPTAQSSAASENAEIQNVSGGYFTIPSTLRRRKTGTKTADTGNSWTRRDPKGFNNNSPVTTTLNGMRSGSSESSNGLTRARDGPFNIPDDGNQEMASSIKERQTMEPLLQDAITGAAEVEQATEGFEILSSKMPGSPLFSVQLKTTPHNAVPESKITDVKLVGPFRTVSASFVSDSLMSHALPLPTQGLYKQDNAEQTQGDNIDIIHPSSRKDINQSTYTTTTMFSMSSYQPNTSPELREVTSAAVSNERQTTETYTNRQEAFSERSLFEFVKPTKTPVFKLTTAGHLKDRMAGSRTISQNLESEHTQKTGNAHGNEGIVNGTNVNKEKHKSNVSHGEKSKLFNFNSLTRKQYAIGFTTEKNINQNKPIVNGILIITKDLEKPITNLTSMATADENTESSRATLALSPDEPQVNLTFGSPEEEKKYHYENITTVSEANVHHKEGVNGTSVKEGVNKMTALVHQEHSSHAARKYDEVWTEDPMITVKSIPINKENPEFSQKRSDHVDRLFLNSSMHDVRAATKQIDRKKENVFSTGTGQDNGLGSAAEQFLHKSVVVADKVGYIPSVSTAQTFKEHEHPVTPVYSSSQHSTWMATTSATPSSIGTTMFLDTSTTIHMAQQGGEIQTTSFSPVAQTEGSYISSPALMKAAVVSQILTNPSKASAHLMSTASAEELQMKELHVTATSPSYPRSHDPVQDLNSATDQPDHPEKTPVTVLTDTGRQREATTVIGSSEVPPVSCGGVLQGDKGEFQSPGFPQSYPSNMDCTWEVTAPPGHLILLAFHSMALEEHKGCQYDFITVFDGKREEGVELGRFCGSQLPPPLRSSSNTMTVQLRSDASVELDGFSVRFHSVKPPSSLPGRVRLRGGRNRFEGLVEMAFGGALGRVCAEQWEKREATVVCRQLGFPGAAIAYRVQSQARDPPVTVSYVECSGDESSLDECEVKWGRECSTTERAAVHCQVMETCSILRSAGVLESGTYVIDPDGEDQGVEPFPVFCDMNSLRADGVTVVGHDSESRTRVSPCEKAGCYSRHITYRQASLLQLRSLIQASESCTQLVKLECRHTRFLGEEWGWWVSWDGRRMNSWGGTSTDSKKCACGERGDCDLGLLTCNCDANDEVWRSDEGYLSDKASLPMREVRLGDTQDMPMEMAFHTIGKLFCTGQKTLDPVLESCAALKEAGFVESRRYIIDPDGPGQGLSQFEVYCDMASDPLTGITVVSHNSGHRMRVAPCEEKGCYRKELQYEADLPQLHALTQVSRSCQQYVKLDCRHTRFVQSGWGWWVSWDGQKMLDWGGAERNSGSCACGMTGTCFGMGRLCNCDSNDHVWRMDEGFLRDKNSLPVKAVHFGDTKDAPLEMAFHTVGKLTCKGKISSTSPSI